jgi:hypothetical protein
MKERPILFQGAMVRAILDGSKTQTRRVVKPQPPSDKPRCAWFEPGVMGWAPPDFPSQDWHRVRCPYGQPGDRLWVRESYSGPWELTGQPPRDWPASTSIWYWADGNPTHIDLTKPKPGMHMPRWASRILLEITGVRVERLQDISRGDAMAEGCPFPNMAKGDDPRQWYAELWKQINGPDSWAANPWVWVVEFRKATP